MEKKVKSFVLRARTTKAQALALETYWEKFGIKKQCKDSLDKIFGRKAKRILDIGFGAGDTLLSLAKNNPNKDFIGIEVHKSGIGAVINLAKKLNIENIRIAQEDAFVFLQDLKFNQAFEATILFFPDPWPKTKHKKRRLIQEDFINILERITIKGGYFICKTDCEDYALHILKLFNKNDRWVKFTFPDLPTLYRCLPMTNFERKARNDNRKSTFIVFQKV